MDQMCMLDPVGTIEWHWGLRALGAISIYIYRYLIVLMNISSYISSLLVMPFVPKRRVGRSM